MCRHISWLWDDRVRGVSAGTFDFGRTIDANILREIDNYSGQGVIVNFENSKFEYGVSDPNPNHFHGEMNDAVFGAKFMAICAVLVEFVPGVI